MNKYVVAVVSGVCPWCVRAEADLAAERAARRKWELRLRWRRSHPEYEATYDRLIERSFTKCGPRNLRSWPIAGPRGLLP